MKKVHALQLAGYIHKATTDSRLSTSHLSLYIGLLASWQKQNCITEFRITRKEIMGLAKIAAISTYHRCMNEMIKYGYFKYVPEYDSYKGSKVIFNNDQC